MTTYLALLLVAESEELEVYTWVALVVASKVAYCFYTFAQLAKMLHLAAAAALMGAAYAQNSSSLPTVDLGYEIYRAAGFNVRRCSRHIFASLTHYQGHWQLLQLLQHQVCRAACW